VNPGSGRSLRKRSTAIAALGSGVNEVVAHPDVREPEVFGVTGGTADRLTRGNAPVLG
jgi:hypothetical protein